MTTRDARTSLRLVGEFFVIVIGVLVALAADSWNDARLDRRAEQDYLQRLRASVLSDTADFRSILDWMDEKEAGLARLGSLLSSSSLEFSNDTVLADLTAAANYAWNLAPLVGRATFEDLRSSGRLGLIQDTDLRTRIIDYYEAAEGEEQRIQARRTVYPDLSYQLVPFDRSADSEDERASSSDVAALMERLRQSELPQHILAETNRALFIRGSISRMRGTALDLLDAIELGLSPSR